MKTIVLTFAAVAALTPALAGCATSREDRFAEQCERERAEKRALAIAAGTALGAAAGAAVAKNDTQGAALGGAAGALLGSQFGGGYSEVCRDYFSRYPEAPPSYRNRYGY